MSTVSKQVSTAATVSTVRKNWVLFVVSLTTFMVFVDATVVNTALPSIARDFAATNSTLQWVVNSYSLLVAGLLLVGGTSGDRFGRRRLLAIGAVCQGRCENVPAGRSKTVPLNAVEWASRFVGRWRSGSVR